jgi:hypothetical protein
MNSNRDSALLDLLAEEGRKNGQRWVCRQSTTGRGLRLHQVTPDGLGGADGTTHTLSGQPTFVSPREAIEHFVDQS